VRVTYSPRALRDLIDIGGYLSERNPSGAARVEQRIRVVVDLVASFPESGRVVASRPTVRVMPLGAYPYLLFYTVLDDELVILHVRHAAMKPVFPSEL
jgi:plasmid stabilization system protein ParE